MNINKRVIRILPIFLFVFLLFYIWNNILVLDDYHHFNEAFSEHSEDIGDTTPDTESALGDNSIESNMSVSVQDKGFHIYINLDILSLFLYKDGELVKTYPVSGGKPETPSPEGTWKIINKADWGKGFGGSWMELNVPWGKYGIHGTNYPWFVGKQNASHGCIRMKSENARELYGIVPYGTPVTIVQKNRAFKVLKSGDVGSDVLKLQKALKSLGYFHDWPSGKFGENLKKSVIKFQKANKYKVTGTVDKSLYDIIIQKYRDKLEEESGSKS